MLIYFHNLISIFHIFNCNNFFLNWRFIKFTFRILILLNQFVFRLYFIWWRWIFTSFFFHLYLPFFNFFNLFRLFSFINFQYSSIFLVHYFLKNFIHWILLVILDQKTLLKNLCSLLIIFDLSINLTIFMILIQ